MAEPIIKRFSFWDPGMWSIPKLYWDAFSEEQRIHAICKQLAKVIGYADYLGMNVNDIAERLKAIEEGQLDPYIIAEIEQWFNDNQPAIVQAITDLGDAMPISDFDAEHTIKDSIDNNAQAITDLGDAMPLSDFNAEHTIKDYIDNKSPIIGYENLDKSLQAIDVTHLNWYVLDRFPITETNNASSGFSAQASCVFEKGGTKYIAMFIRDDANTEAGKVNSIWIRNTETNTTTARLTISPCHGLAIDYNAETNELAYYDEVTQKIDIVSLAAIDNPYLSRQIDASGTLIQYGICWYEDGNFIAYREVSATSRYLTILDGTDLHTIGNVELSGYDPITPTYQDMDYYNGIVAIGAGVGIFLYDVESGKQINVIPIPNHVSFIDTQEMEGITIDDECVYWSAYNSVDTLLLPVMFYWNYRRGNLKVRDTCNTYENSNTVGTCYIDFNEGSYLRFVTSSKHSRVFKLLGDFENFVKFNYPGSNAIVHLDDDYPLYSYFTNFNMYLYTDGYDLEEGMRYDQGLFTVSFETSGTNVGSQINVQNAIVNVNYPGRATATGTLFSFTNSLVFSNQAVHHSKWTHTLILAPSIPTDFTATPYDSKWIQGSNTLN